VVPQLGPQWKGLRVEGEVHPFNDYPCLNGSIPAFSERAVQGLRDFLSTAGELLKFQHSGRSYFAFNVQRMPEVLDRGRTVATWANPKYGVHASTIDHFEFYEDRLNDLSIFRLLEQPYTICVTERFVERVHQLSLNGFSFYKLWPLPPGGNWWELRNAVLIEDESRPSPQR
jgi:hypothetical protein